MEKVIRQKRERKKRNDKGLIHVKEKRGRRQPLARERESEIDRRKVRAEGKDKGNRSTVTGSRISTYF